MNDLEQRAQARLRGNGAAVSTRGDDMPPMGGVELVCAADVPPVPIYWLWPGWLARGKVHVIAGAPGGGKTSITLAVAATVTRGGVWPDGSRAPCANVLIWSGEDDWADTLVPRLLAAGADLHRIYFVGRLCDDDNLMRPFDPATDMDCLTHEAARIGNMALLLVDPVVSAVAGDSHKNAEVRRGLQPLVDLATERHCAVLGVSHLSKGSAGRDPVERINGSIAFGALARLVMVTARQESDDDRPERRLLLRAKSNNGPDRGGFVYELQREAASRRIGLRLAHRAARDAAGGRRIPARRVRPACNLAARQSRHHPLSRAICAKHRMWRHWRD